jgi:hypothetical protein
VGGVEPGLGWHAYACYWKQPRYVANPRRERPGARWFVVDGCDDDVVLLHQCRQVIDRMVAEIPVNSDAFGDKLQLIDGPN